MDKFSYLGNADVGQIDALYRQFLENPSSVEDSWKEFFGGFEFARTNFPENGKSGKTIPENVQKEFNVINLINGYRTRGHLFTHTNPVRERRHYSALTTLLPQLCFSSSLIYNKRNDASTDIRPL